jgi:DNA polymerase III delta subunit
VAAAAASSFFGTKKCVLVTDCYFLSSDMDKAPASFDKQQDYQALINYLEHPNPDTDLYLLTQGKLAASGKEKPFMEAVRKYAEISDESSSPMSEEELAQWGLRYVGEKKADIDHASLIELVERSSNDYLLLKNNLDKLLCYTDKIRASDLDDLVAPKIENSVFKVVNCLFRNAMREAVKDYRDLRQQGIQMITLLSIFASQFRFLYQVAHLVSIRMNDIDMYKELGCSPTKIKYARKDVGLLPASAILAMMAELGEIEYHVKFDLDDGDVLMELFLVNFRRNYLSQTR